MLLKHSLIDEIPSHISCSVLFLGFLHHTIKHVCIHGVEENLQGECVENEAASSS